MPLTSRVSASEFKGLVLKSLGFHMLLLLKRNIGVYMQHKSLGIEGLGLRVAGLGFQDGILAIRKCFKLMGLWG